MEPQLCDKKPVSKHSNADRTPVPSLEHSRYNAQPCFTVVHPPRVTLFVMRLSFLRCFYGYRYQYQCRPCQEPGLAGLWESCWRVSEAQGPRSTYPTRLGETTFPSSRTLAWRSRSTVTSTRRTLDSTSRVSESHYLYLLFQRTTSVSDCAHQAVWSERGTVFLWYRYFIRYLIRWAQPQGFIFYFTLKYPMEMGYSSTAVVSNEVATFDAPSSRGREVHESLPIQQRLPSK